MESHTLVVVGANSPDGTRGFILDQRADFSGGVRGRGEDLQDHACTLRDLEQRANAAHPAPVCEGAASASAAYD